MSMAAEKFDQLLGLPGLSDGLLSNHFALYEGYVSNTNKLMETLDKLETEGREAGPEYAELKRRFGWEWNGMRLHELYFGNLTKEFRALEENSGLHRKLVEQFGSFVAWEKSFRATAAMRGIGWVILYLDRESGRLCNAWVGEHDSGHLAGAEPLLVLDVFEHAHYLDYGRDRAKYIEAIMSLLDWRRASERFDRAVAR